MMADRYKPIFFAIISSTIVWFIIVLLCLPQNGDDLMPDQKQKQWSESYDQQSTPSTAGQTINLSSANIHHNHNDDPHRYYPNRIPDYMKYFHRKKKHREFSKLDIIFYQLNAPENKLNNDSDDLKVLPVDTQVSITRDKHLRETLELKSINNPTDRYVKSEGDRLFAFNLLVSNRIGTFRPLPDTRHAKCHDRQKSPIIRQQSFLETQPQSRVSIIICYYNEAPSALLRTIYSILKRTAREYVQEILIVDDSSEPEYDITKIKPFVSDPLVVMTRTERREGLIRARLFGTNMAKGQILLFLDSHVEPNIGWIEPLVETVQKNKSTIACPVIDLINSETLVYTSSPLVKGGMNWALNFKWDSVPTEKLRTYDDFVRPIESPTMAGGLFAIDKEFFNSIGSYDPGMELWGGENIELSLRTWMCGGKIVILPCSRVGHIFRKRRPYGPEPNQPDSLLLNSHRVARVWLDGYIDKFYDANPDAKYLVSGDVSKRLDLRYKLGCKNFLWFLENIYPDLAAIKKIQAVASDNEFKAKPSAIRNNRPQRQVPTSSLRLKLALENNMMQAALDSENDRTVGHRPSTFLPKMLAQFQIRSENSDLCIESRRIHTGAGYTRLLLNHCARIERNSDGEILINNSTIMDQIWTETELHDLRVGPNRCLDVFKNLPLVRKCHNMGSFQGWLHNFSNQTSETVIFNARAGLCLGVERIQTEEPIIVTICDKATYERHNYTATKMHYQYWRWRQTNQQSFGSRTLSGQKGSRSSYHLNQTRPSQSWRLLPVDNSFN